MPEIPTPFSDQSPSAMDFWGIEVKPGETVKYRPGGDEYLHLSKALLGELKTDNQGSESVTLYVEVNDQKLVIGTLSADKCPQTTYDLVFKKEFELSHSGKSGSVFFIGHTVQQVVFLNGRVVNGMETLYTPVPSRLGKLSSQSSGPSDPQNPLAQPCASDGMQQVLTFIYWDGAGYSFIYPVTIVAMTFGVLFFNIIVNLVLIV